MLAIRKKNWKRRSMGKLELRHRSHCSWTEKGARGVLQGEFVSIPQPTPQFLELKFFYKNNSTQLTLFLQEL